nr:type II toxin-antitoxin system RelE/ParE family toxin [Endozoicomonas sp.]
MKQFDETFHLLSERPELGKSCDQIRKGYLKFPQGSHVIFFRQINKSRIQIVRILHKNMDMDVDMHFGAYITVV